MLLFKELLVEACSQDVCLSDDTCNDFDLTGKLLASNHFDQRSASQLPTEALRSVANRAREVLLASVKSSGDQEIDRGVLQATMKERDQGFVKGPISADVVPDGTNRLQSQSRKLCSDSVEMVTLHGVDHIACLGSALLQAVWSETTPSGLVAKCWDIAPAYKQVPLSEEAYEKDSYIVIYNPETQQQEVFKQAVLPCGPIASVMAFLRCVIGIWHIGSSLLKLTWTSYFDGFLSLAPHCLARHTDLCISTFFHLLGWQLSEDKWVPMLSVAKFLEPSLISVRVQLEPWKSATLRAEDTN